MDPDDISQNNSSVQLNKSQGNLFEKGSGSPSPLKKQWSPYSPKKNQGI